MLYPWVIYCKQLNLNFFFFVFIINFSTKKMNAKKIENTCDDLLEHFLTRINIFLFPKKMPCIIFNLISKD
jgi:hypothetical protein